jgi:hypothetical protein
MAQEVTFSISRCRFVVRTSDRAVRIERGTVVDAIVDGAATSYRLLPPADIEVPADGELEMDAESTGPAGWMQLDHPGHFRLSPALGVTVENVTPSVGDVEPTGRDFTEMTDQPVSALRLAIRRQSIA